MGKIIITKRNYKPLIDFSIFIVIFLFVRVYFVNNTKLLNSKIDILYMDTIRPFTELSKIAEPIHSKIAELEIQFGGVIVLFGLIVFYNLSKYFKLAKHKFVLLIIEVVLVWSVFSSTTTEMRLNAIKDDNYFISLLIFAPFLFFIYHNTVTGKRVDITENIKEKETSVHNDKINDLDKLFKLNLISEEEYRQKKEFQVKSKISAEVKEMEEYSLLSKSKQKGLLTEEEFNTKVENLVTKKYNADK
jgi:Short C-terminal domain